MAYQIEIWKMNVSATYGTQIKWIKRQGGIVKSSYEIGEINVTEIDLQQQDICHRYKFVKFNKAALIITVSSQVCVQDKDVFPFFNSLNINGVSIQNPNADNNKYKTYAIDYPTKNKTDTVKQIVYVNSNSKSSYQYEKLSDIDKNIPQCSTSNPYRFALVVGNEDYTSHQSDLKSESNVDFARNDASAFKEYCIKTMGIPEKNITFYLMPPSGRLVRVLTS